MLLVYLKQHLKNQGSWVHLFFEKIRDSALGTFVLYVEFDRNKLVSAGFRIFLLGYGQNVKDLGNKVIHWMKLALAPATLVGSILAMGRLTMVVVVMATQGMTPMVMMANWLWLLQWWLDWLWQQWLDRLWQQWFNWLWLLQWWLDWLCCQSWWLDWGWQWWLVWLRQWWLDWLW